MRARAQTGWITGFSWGSQAEEPDQVQPLYGPLGSLPVGEVDGGLFWPPEHLSALTSPLPAPVLSLPMLNVKCFIASSWWSSVDTSVSTEPLQIGAPWRDLPFPLKSPYSHMCLSNKVWSQLKHFGLSCLHWLFLEHDNISSGHHSLLTHWRPQSVWQLLSLGQ